jgi:hypothetical protein
VDFPLCRKCHERLVQCGYCREFERGDAEGAGTCHSQAAGGPRETRAEEGADCPHFQARYAAGGGRGKRVAIHPAAYVLGIIAVVFIVLFALSAIVRPANDPALMTHLEAHVPVAVRSGSEFTIDLTARNLGADGAEAVRLGIPAAFRQRFSLTGPEPEPSARRETPETTCFLYPAVRRGQWLKVRLRATAPEPGDYELQARLVGLGAGGEREIRVPIRVEPAEGSPGSRESGAR